MGCPDFDLNFGSVNWAELESWNMQGDFESVDCVNVITFW